MQDSHSSQPNFNTHSDDVGGVFISAVEAGKRYHLTNDHIAWLCRKAKIEGKLVGRVRYVSEPSLKAYLEKTKLEKDNRHSKLSKQMRGEQEVRAISTSAPIARYKVRHAPMMALAGVFVFLVMGAGAASAYDLTLEYKAISPGLSTALPYVPAAVAQTSQTYWQHSFGAAGVIFVQSANELEAGQVQAYLSMGNVLGGALYDFSQQTAAVRDAYIAGVADYVSGVYAFGHMENVGYDQLSGAVAAAWNAVSPQASGGSADILGAVVAANSMLGAANDSMFDAYGNTAAALYAYPHFLLDQYADLYIQGVIAFVRGTYVMRDADVRGVAMPMAQEAAVSVGAYEHIGGAFMSFAQIFNTSVYQLGDQSSAVANSELNVATVWSAWTGWLASVIYPTTAGDVAYSGPAYLPAGKSAGIVSSSLGISVPLSPTTSPVVVKAATSTTESQAIVTRYVFEPAPVATNATYVTQSDLTTQLQELGDNLRQLIYQNAGTVGEGQYSTGGNINNIALSQIVNTLPSGITAGGSPVITQANLPSLPSIVGAPSYGQLLLGNQNGGFDLVSTSSLGISGGGGTSFTPAYPLALDGSDDLSLAFGTTTSNSWSGTQTFSTATTTNLFSNIANLASATIGSLSIGSTLNLNGQALTGLPLPTTSTDAATKGYVDSFAQGLVWQSPVIGVGSTTPPVSPSSGDRYVLGTGSSGAWSGHDNAVAQWNGSSWTFTAPSQGFTVYATNVGLQYNYNGSAWVQMGSGLNLSATTGILGITQGGTGIQSTPSYGQLLVGNNSGGYGLLATSSLGILNSNANANFGSVTLSNALSMANGGTGTSTSPSANKLLLSDANGNWEYVATSSLGVSAPTYTLTYPLQNSGDVISLAFGTTTSNTWSSQQIFTSNVGIGTSSPFAALSVAGDALITGGATTTNFFASIASSTNLFASVAQLASATIGALTLNTPLAITSGGTGTSTAPSANQLLLSDSNGNWEYVSTSSLGISSGSSFSYPFPSNATSTLLAFNGGFTSYASSTIGSGSIGLTVNGPATTTGNVYFANKVSIGTSTQTIGQLFVGANTSAMFIATSTQVGNFPQGLALQGHYAYVANDGDGTISIVDITNPTSPTTTATFTLPQVKNIAVQGRYAYVTSGNNALYTLDVSNASAPVLVSKLLFVSTADTYGVAVSGRFAYIVDNYNNTLNIIDVGNPSAPVQIATTSLLSGARYIAVQGNYAYVTDSTSDTVSIINISNPYSPSVVASPSVGLNPEAIAVQGKYVYTANYGGSSVSVIDVSNPSDPIVATYSLTFGSPYGIAVAGRNAYVTDVGGSGKMYVLDISGGLSLSTVGSIVLSETDPFAVAVSGRYAYVIQYDGFKHLDVVDLGGAYTSSLEAGSAQVSSLDVRNSFSADVGSLINGLSVGGSLQASIASFVAPTSTVGTTNSIFSVATASSTNPILNILGNGNVGIGTTSPFAALSVNGSGYFGGNLMATNITATGTVNVGAQSSGYLFGGNAFLYASSTNKATVVGESSGAQLFANATASNNTVVGFNALASATFSGSDDNAFGVGVLYSNTSAIHNNAFGTNALYLDTTGGYNAAFGDSAGYNNTTGIYNTYIGNASGEGASGQGQSYNTGIGYDTLTNITGTSGGYNTTLGYQAGISITSGSNNILIGPSVNSASENQITSGSNNIAIGYDIAVPLATASNQLDIGNLIYGTGLNGSGLNLSTGNLGVETTSPYARFVIYGGASGNLMELDSTASNASTTLLQMSNAGLLSIGADNQVGVPSGIFTVDASSSTTTISNLSIGDLTFDTDAGIVNLSDIPVDTNAASGVQEAQIINIGGNPVLTISGISNGSGSATSLGVGIGTTTPYAALQVTGADTSASTAAFIVANSASTTELVVYDNGSATLAGSLSQNSDERLKTNVQSLDASTTLSLISELNPVTYNWIDPTQSTSTQYGLIAQQVQQIFPQLVATTTATALTPDGTLSVNYIGFIGPIIEAVKALIAEIDGFKQQFTTQELCVADNTGATTCITKSQLDALLKQAGQGSAAPQTQSAPSSSDTSQTDSSSDSPSNSDTASSTVSDSSASSTPDVSSDDASSTPDTGSQDASSTPDTSDAGSTPNQ